MHTSVALSNSLGRFLNSVEFTESYTPFQMVSDLSKDSNLWNKLLLRSARILLNREASPEELPTSCLINFCALNILFLGKE